MVTTLLSELSELSGLSELSVAVGLSDCRTVGPCWDSYDSLGQSIHMVTGVFAVVVLSDSVGAVGAVDCRSCRSCRSAVGVLSDFAVVLSYRGSTPARYVGYVGCASLVYSPL